jgi:tetratricopeptide (TPR) repeat protein
MPSLVLRIARIIAFALLGVSLWLHWFHVPVGVQEKTNGAFAIVFAQPATTVPFKLFVFVVLVAAWLLGRRLKHSGSVSWATPLTVAGFILLLGIGVVYPAVTMQRCGEISAHAGWLQQQNFSLIVSVGDNFLAQEYFYQPGQPGVEVNEVLPRSFETMPTPSIFGPADLHLTKLQHFFIWLGLSPGFCQFVSWGWFCGLFAALLLIICFMPLKGNQRSSSGDRKSLYRLIGVFGISGVTVCLIGLLPIMMAAQQLEKAQAAANVGDFSKSLHHLDLAEEWVPVLAYHTDLLFQRGWLEEKVGRQSPVRRVYLAIREEEEGFTEQAAKDYANLLNPENPQPVRGEAYRGALRLAIKDFNTGLVARAAATLERLTTIDPSSVKADYAMQLAHLRLYRKTQLEQDVAKFETIYDCFESPEKSPLIAAAHRRLADLEFDYRDLARLGDEMRAAVTPLTQ